jgi:hypothetical protein
MPELYGHDSPKDALRFIQYFEQTTDHTEHDKDKYQSAIAFRDSERGQKYISEYGIPVYETYPRY